MLMQMRNHWARVRHSSRRGVSAMEFGLVAPILVVMVMGLIDYGWFFSREALITSALEGAVRAGGNISPDMGEADGECAECLLAAKSYAVSALNEMGLTFNDSSIQPEIIPLEGTCAIRLCPELPFEPLMNMVPVPDDFGAVCTVALAQTVDGC